MAKSTLIENGEITEVYYNLGTFTNDQRKKFVKAPFDLVKINGAQYIQPLAVGGSTEDLSAYSTISSADDNEYWMGRRDFGFINLNPMVLNESQVGDLGDTPVGQFSCGMI